MDDTTAPAPAPEPTPAADPTPAPAPPADPTPPPISAKAAAIDRAVERWIDEHLRDSPLARATDVWNFVQTKIAHLKSIIEQEV